MNTYEIKLQHYNTAKRTMVETTCLERAHTAADALSQVHANILDNPRSHVGGIKPSLISIKPKEREIGPEDVPDTGSAFGMRDSRPKEEIKVSDAPHTVALTLIRFNLRKDCEYYERMMTKCGNEGREVDEAHHAGRLKQARATLEFIGDRKS